MNSVLNSLIYPVSFLFVLSVIVVVHELGHFLAARMCGVAVEAFSFGFGRVLWHRKDKHGTEWQISLLPLGGYVKMLGDADASSAKADEEKIRQLTDEEKKHAFAFQNVWKKLFIVFAGPAMNYVLAIVLLTGFFSAYGVLNIQPVVSAVAENSAAQKAGIQVNDRFVRVNGEEITEFSQLRRLVGLDKTLHITVERDGKNVELTAYLSKETGGAVLGVMSNADMDNLIKVSVWGAFKQALKDTWEMTVDTTVILKRIIMRQRSTEDMRGPLGIAEASGDAFRAGFEMFILFIVQVSVGIGFVNLLPVPVLDGGNIVILLIESVIRRPLGEKAQTVSVFIGFVFLLGLLVLTSWNDVARIFQRLFG